MFDFSFLKSNRFYAILAVCVLSILKTFNIIESAVADPIIIFLLTFAGIRSLDRAFEQLSIK